MVYQGEKKTKCKKLFSISVLILMLFSLIVLPQSAEAGLFDSIGNFFEGVRDDARNELGRSRIGRELNRIVDDVIAVTEIVEELGNVAVMIGSATTPIGIANLAIQYGHDPDQLFGRFQERVDTLRNNNPGTELTAMEAAAALQSVLEEPVLPEGVYMGDSCIIDLSRCEDASTNQNTVERAYYWHHSCYLEGTISKKNIGGGNKAVCIQSWVNTWTGANANVEFLVDYTLGQYEWQQCPRVYLTQQEQNQFLASKNQQCTQPTIAKHDLGDVCAVDYRSCSYGQYGVYNANRVGTIKYNLLHTLVGSKRDYACETTYTISPLLEPGRQSCETVYVGNREVNEFIANNPEPVQTSVAPTVTPPTPAPSPATSVTPPIQISGVFSTRDRLSYVIESLGDVPYQNTEENFSITVFGRDGVKDINTISISEKKKATAKTLQKYGVQDGFNINAIKNEVEGQELPSPIKTIFKNERAMLTISRNIGEDFKYCITVEDGVVQEFATCTDSFNPTVKVYTSESVINELQDGADINEMLDQGRIAYQAVGFTKKAKFGVASLLVKVFG